jgi:carbonic anhydrase
MMNSFVASAIAGCAAAAGGPAYDWSYLKMGKDWGTLADKAPQAHRQCETGKHQSPIDLNPAGDEIKGDTKHAIKVQNFED